MQNTLFQSDDSKQRPSFFPQSDNTSYHARSHVASQAPRYNTDIRPRDDSWIEKAKEIRRDREIKKERDAEVKAEERVQYRYIGQAFKLFLIAELDGELYFVDQHAAHERIIYDELLKKESVQPLLVPIELDAEDDVVRFLDGNSQIYERLGITLEKST